MRYEFVGKKIPEVGKTLWEIVGNLKNFGIGRLVITSTYLKYPEPSFFKIVKVQPLPPSKKQFKDRDVMVWVEEIYRGRKIEGVHLATKTSYMPKFMLIPKLEEEKYLKLAEEFADKDFRTPIPKYIKWPPLYKELWEFRSSQLQNKVDKIPKLKTIIQNDPYNTVKLGESEEPFPNLSSNLYKEDMSVEEMIREIVRLQKIVNAHSET